MGCLSPETGARASALLRCQTSYGCWDQQPGSGERRARAWLSTGRITAGTPGGASPGGEEGLTPAPSDPTCPSPSLCWSEVSFRTPLSFPGPGHRLWSPQWTVPGQEVLKAVGERAVRRWMLPLSKPVGPRPSRQHSALRLTPRAKTGGSGSHVAEEPHPPCAHTPAGGRSLSDQPAGRQPRTPGLPS